jgi:hypothetical protein
MDSQIYAEIVITCKEKNLDELTIITSLKPRRQHRINDVSVTGIKLDYSEWIFATEIIEAWDTEQVTNRLVDYFSRNFFDVFRQFLLDNKCEVCICIVIREVGDATPALSLNKEIIDMAYKLNARIDFDGIYT